MKHPVITLANAAAGTVDLPDALFGIDPREDVMARVVLWQLAKRRAGTHAVKSRSEVSGTTKKVYRQKGTGSARHGSVRAPQYRHGGIVHGPQVRDHGYSLQKKVRRLGLLSALSQKVLGKNLIILDKASGFDKTKDANAAMSKIGVKSALIIDKEVDEAFARSIANLPKIDLLPVVGANVFDVVNHDTLIITKAGVESLIERLGGKA